jgi:hypothetical protein
MAGRMPELRDAFLYRRVFLNPRTARLDLAAAGALIAAVRRSPLPLVTAAPYLRELRRHARRAETGAGPSVAGPSVAGVAAADLAADLVGLAALAVGSIRYGAPVL